MPQLDPVKSLFLSQLFWFAVCFIALYIYIAFYVTPRIEGVLKNRKSAIQADFDLSDSLRSQTQFIIESYEAKLVKAKQTATQNIEQSRLSFVHANDAQKNVHTAKMAVQLTAAEAKIEAQRVAALVSIQDTAAELAGDAIVKISGHKETTKSIQAALKAVV